MDLTERLTEAVEQIPGAVAISLLGMDGVAVETIHGPKPWRRESMPPNGGSAGLCRSLT